MEKLWLSECTFIIPQVQYHRERVWFVGFTELELAFSCLEWGRCSSYLESTWGNGPNGVPLHHPTLSWLRLANHNTPTECNFENETIPSHFIHCRLNANITRRIKGSLSHSAFLNKLLEPKCFESFKNNAQDTNCFEYSLVYPTLTLSGD